MVDNILSQQTITIDDPSTFVMKYLRRLHLNPTEFIQNPTIENLFKIQEAHLQYIAFENLSQHGCTYPATVTNMNIVATKILDHKRGGFCFEVNGLLAELLIELGYIVCRVPANVYIDNKMFRDVQSHLILIVTCPPSITTSKSSLWMVDVGFGEPSIHPLPYDTFDEVQMTPDNMQSKICKVNDGTDDVILYWWYAPLNDWVPRLKWKYNESMLGSNGPAQSSFTSGLDSVLEDTSIFAQKLICCRLTRDQKFTVAGNKFKITGPPRFIVDGGTSNSTPMNVVNDGDNATSTTAQNTPPVTIQYIESEDELRNILNEHFGIPIESTIGLSLSKSLAANQNIWSNQ